MQPRKKFAFSKKKNDVCSVEKNGLETKIIKKEDNQKENAKPNDFMQQIDGVENLKSETVIFSKENLKNTWKVINNKSSDIYLNSIFDCVFIKNNKNCRIFVGPVKASVFIDNNEDCEIFVMSHQVNLKYFFFIFFYERLESITAKMLHFIYLQQVKALLRIALF